MSVADFLVIDEPRAGIQRLRARFCGHAYDPHRHETYAVGLTERGIQAFSYRGAACASTAGRVIVLHPDEVHDGHAVEPEGFSYRMLYVDAAAISEAIGGSGALPSCRRRSAMTLPWPPCWTRRSKDFRTGLVPLPARRSSRPSPTACAGGRAGRAPNGLAIVRGRG
jgi:hypothetical protein